MKTRINQQYKTSIGKNLFEKKHYNVILNGGRDVQKMANRVLELIEFQDKHPDKNTLFGGKSVAWSIERCMKHLGLKWHIYIEQDYYTLTRDTFIGKFKVLGEIE